MGKDGSAKTQGPIWLLIVGGLGNLVLAGVAAWTSHGKSQAEAAKMSAEANTLQLRREIEIQANSPSIATYHLMVELPILNAFLQSKDPLPFAYGVDGYAFFENAGLGRLQSELAALHGNRNHRGGQVTFLVIANSASKPAENTVLHLRGSPSLGLGTLAGNTAILVPVSYQPSGAAIEVFVNSPERVEYVARIGVQQRSVSREIVRLQNPLWMLSLGGTGRAYGRANALDTEQRGPALPD